MILTYQRLIELNPALNNDAYKDQIETVQLAFHVCHFNSFIDAISPLPIELREALLTANFGYHFTPYQLFTELFQEKFTEQLRQEGLIRTQLAQQLRRDYAALLPEDWRAYLADLVTGLSDLHEALEKEATQKAQQSKRIEHQHKQQLALAELQVSELEKRLRSFSAHQQSKANAKSATELRAVKQDRDALVKELALLQSQNEKLKADCDARDSSIEALRRDLEVLRAEQDKRDKSLEEKNAALEQQLKSLQRAQKQELKTLKKENARLEALHGKREQELTQLNSRLVESENAAKSLFGQIWHARSDLLESQKTIGLQQEIIEGLQQQSIRHQQSFRQEQSMLIALRTMVSERDNLIAELKSRLSAHLEQGIRAPGTQLLHNTFAASIWTRRRSSADSEVAPARATSTAAAELVLSSTTFS